MVLRAPSQPVTGTPSMVPKAAMMDWFLLIVAILLELVGTISMKMSQGLTRLEPSIAIVLGYGLSSIALTLALRSIPLSVAYAIWSGAGTACAVGVGAMFFDEPLTLVKIGSMVLIVLGVIGLRLG